MSNSVISNVSDGTSAYWNPAGLLNIKNKYEVSLMHSEYFAGIANYDFIGFSMPIDTLSHISFSVIRFGIDDIPDTRFLYDANGAINYDNIRFFSAADYAFVFSYARKLSVLGGIRIGVTSKWFIGMLGNLPMPGVLGWMLELRKRLAIGSLV